MLYAARRIKRLNPVLKCSRSLKESLLTNLQDFEPVNICSESRWLCSISALAVKGSDLRNVFQSQYWKHNTGCSVRLYLLMNVLSSYGSLMFITTQKQRFCCIVDCSSSMKSSGYSLESIYGEGRLKRTYTEVDKENIDQP